MRDLLGVTSVSLDMPSAWGRASCPKEGRGGAGGGAPHSKDVFVATRRYKEKDNNEIKQQARSTPASEQWYRARIERPGTLS